ncbi:MAG: hypothetical protein ACFWTM_07740 [Mitsuokella multacida]|jgi:Flp pilus assembly protein TadG
MSRDHKGEKGAILVLTAFLLPFIIAFTGMAVDLGNLYVQHQRLQNAADAAALAGAGNFQSDTKDITTAKSNADKAATENGDINCDGSMKNTQVTMVTKIDDSSKPSYYGVKMTKPVPIYFLSIFPKIDSTYDINAVATAKLNIVEHNANKEVLMDALIYATNKMYVVGELDHWDQRDRKDNIGVTFDGKIFYTNPYVMYRDNGDSWMGRPINQNIFLTSKAQSEKLSVNEALSRSANSGYWHYAEKKYDYNFYDHDSPLAKAFLSREPVNLTADDVNGNRVPTITDNQYIYVRYSNGSNNLNLSNFDTSSGDSNKPIYIMLDSLITTKIELNKDIVRPLIIYYKDYDPNDYNIWIRNAVSVGWLKPYSEVTIEQHGHVFRGIIYNPNGRFHTNANGGTIKGSIVAADIDLQGQPGKYVYEEFTDSGSSGNGSGNGSISPNGHITLVENDKIKWE